MCVCACVRALEWVLMYSVASVFVQIRNAIHAHVCIACVHVCIICVCARERAGKDLEIVRNARQGFCPNNSVVACVDVSDR